MMAKIKETLGVSLISQNHMLFGPLLVIFMLFGLTLRLVIVMPFEPLLVIFMLFARWCALHIQERFLAPLHKKRFSATFIPGLFFVLLDSTSYGNLLNFVLFAEHPHWAA